MKFFSVKNWKRHQSQKTMGGSWFKVQTAFFSEPKLHGMPASVKFQFLGILSLVAQHGNRLPCSDDYIAETLGMTRDECDLPYLIGVGLLVDADADAGEEEIEVEEEDPADDSLAFAREVCARWNEKVGKPEVRGHVSALRRGHINARRAEHGDAAIFEAIDNRAGSAFMGGENDKGWIANFSWIFNSAENFAKTLEGNYTDKTKKGTKTRDTDASGSDFFYADRCCEMRGLDSEDMTRAERIDILNEDLAVIVTAARAEDKDIRGSVSNLFKWYTEKFGKHPDGRNA